ncbi:hypothetical protein ASPBRDRAFT_659792 [Aspergillus brasiliensis CBS 101740]|uniref:NADH:flavin oxidoreductase/NADH oxidase N-terminal domain-containing protein n=1 Tax=Aspergillus brasiliensis (strain CBS 101740 / IMI 381727 / IBT 21946) TaxID=767769 RepID=A0A1L9U970_ASPBC|nr:hypothetical protein ASPBRDRAFT_659792 [Aspergillus brasiliensis CBS 101740]
MSQVFLPLQLATMSLRHRVAVAPLRRLRIVRDYYEQHAPVPRTLITTEGLNIDPAFQPPFRLPLPTNAAQVASWKSITDTVAPLLSLRSAYLGEQNSTIVDSQPKFSLAPSAHSPISERDMQEAIGIFVAAAQRAMEAGFDAVQIHGANGYLLDQFTQDTANRRGERWRGNVDDRSRFGVEATRAVVLVIGAENAGYQISPHRDFQGMRMEETCPQFEDHVTKLAILSLASARTLVAQWADKYIVVMFGRFFVANANLPFWFQFDIEFNLWDRDTFSTPQASGCTDYSFRPLFNAELTL